MLPAGDLRTVRASVHTMSSHAETATPPRPPARPGADVFAVLTQSRARLERGVPLGDGFSAAIWRNAHDATRYVAPGHHTVSLYLQGGFDTYRHEAPGARGAPGKLCVMPAGHESSWVVGAEQRFLHLYVEPDRLAAWVVRLFDREPRELQLHDLTFAVNERLAAPLARLAGLDWTDTDDRARANAMAHDVIALLVQDHTGRTPSQRLRGGLSGGVRRRVVDHVDAHLDRSLTVGELAGIAALSEAHFAHMFRASFGMAPHAWVLARRIERARQLLQHTGLPLDAVAQACGFASASHLVRRFAAEVGVPPGRFRQALRTGT